MGITPHDMPACAVCAQPLNRIEVRNAFGVVKEGWVHVGSTIDHDPADHPAVPVSRDAVQLEGRCDFCSAPDPAWQLPVTDLGILIVESADAEVGHNSIGDWAACEECAELIRADRWDALTARSLRILVASSLELGPNRAALAQSLRELHLTVRDHVRGPMVRIEP